MEKWPGQKSEATGDVGVDGWRKKETKGMERQPGRLESRPRSAMEGNEIR